ncbi:unnamed protein product [Heligmosomoides polygyrus]|uniref:Uncharacterized protein n=1 Tax=Heligmosomoides polygyrus TaxID=6339 RepID=A0A183G8X9_HELPZ|nr:unnamed protein product [Heligmosomoides polygyrus]
MEQARKCQNDRIWSTGVSAISAIVEHRQNQQAAMVRAEPAQTEGPFGFCRRGVRTIQDVSRRDILKVAVLPWALLHSVNAQWTFQQDAALAEEHAGVVQVQYLEIHHGCGMAAALPGSDSYGPQRVVHFGGRVCDKRHHSLESLEESLCRK